MSLIPRKSSSRIAVSGEKVATAPTAPLGRREHAAVDAAEHDQEDRATGQMPANEDPLAP